jgi:hypothetical protein
VPRLRMAKFVHASQVLFPQVHLRDGAGGLIVEPQRVAAAVALVDALGVEVCDNACRDKATAQTIGVGGPSIPPARQGALSCDVLGHVVAQNAEFLVAGGFEDIEQTKGAGPPGQRAFNDEALLPSAGNSDEIVCQEWLFDQRIPRPRSAAVCRLARCS